MNTQDLLADLKKIDLAEVRLDNIGSWPLAVRILGCLLVFAAALIAYFALVVAGLNTSLATAALKEQDLKKTFAEQARQAAHLEAYRAQKVELDERLSDLLAQLPRNAEVPSLLEEITETGLNSGLVIDSIELQNEVEHDYYIELPIAIKVAGGYHDFGTFVSGVSGLPRIVTLHDFEITQQEGAATLSLSITAKTYRYKEPGAAEEAQDG
ncbi:MAG: type 4a pilus biogenesis protein PilO [Cellvibrionales bacterium]|nr:type 4a pilus biogenesis protein PilO [Cellvibrionales bacterium]